MTSYDKWSNTPVITCHMIHINGICVFSSLLGQVVPPTLLKFTTVLLINTCIYLLPLRQKKKKNTLLKIRIFARTSQFQAWCNGETGHVHARGGAGRAIVAAHELVWMRGWVYPVALSVCWCACALGFYRQHASRCPSSGTEGCCSKSSASC
jgi:hypothetical protein